MSGLAGMGQPIVGLENGVHALIGDTADELATCAFELMNDRVRTREIGQAGMRLVLKQFSWERTAEGVLQHVAPAPTEGEPTDNAVSA